MGRWHPTSEHQKIIAELQRIGIALLTDNSLFPDPLPNHANPEEEKTAEGPPGDAPAVDPEQLIRSISIQNQGIEHCPWLARTERDHFDRRAAGAI